jgi:hypothetical protein
MSFTEGPSNWLSAIIKQKRAEITRRLKFLERREEQHAILDAIKKHELGAPLAANKSLADVVLASLAVAAAREHEFEKNPKLMSASPEVQASWFIFEELDLQVPA